MNKKISELAKNYAEVDDVRKALKSLQTIKCRLKKQKSRKDYEVEMEKVLVEEQTLKEIRQFMEPTKMTVTVMTSEEIKLLTYEETVRAIKSIQSKKCINKFQPESVEYLSACVIEKQLQEHRETVAEVPVDKIKKSDIMNIIEDLENLEDDIKKETILERLKGLLQ